MELETHRPGLSGALVPLLIILAILASGIYYALFG